MVEFALISTLALLVLVGGVQVAIIGEAGLAVGQLAFQGARYAAVNPSTSQAGVTSYVQSIAPSILGTTKNLSVTMNPSTTPRNFATTVTVTVAYTLGNLQVLPNPFLGVSFPTSVSSTETAMSE